MNSKSLRRLAVVLMLAVPFFVFFVIMLAVPPTDGNADVGPVWHVIIAAMTGIMGMVVGYLFAWGIAALVSWIRTGDAGTPEDFLDRLEGWIEKENP